MFSCMPKYTSSFTSFFCDCIFKNPAIWLGDSFWFWPITQEPVLWQIWECWWNISNNISFHFRLFPGKTNDEIFQKIQKPSKIQKSQIQGPFWALLPKFGQKWLSLEKKRAVSVFKYSNYLPLCKKLEHPIAKKSNELTDTQVCRQTTVIL